MVEAHVLLSDAYWEKSFQFKWDSPEVELWRGKAAESNEQAIRLSPRDPSLHYARLRGLNGPEYLEILEEILTQFPDYPPARRSYASYLKRDNKPERAISEYYRYFDLVAAAEGEVHERDYAQLWSLLTHQGRKDEAITLLNSFMDSKPPQTVAHTINAFFDIDSYTEAEYRETIRKATGYKNYDSDTIYRQARGILNTGQLNAAMNVFSEHIEVNPFNTHYYLQFAQALINREYYREAYIVYELLLDSELEERYKCNRLGDLKLRVYDIGPEGNLWKKLKSVCGYDAVLVK